MKIKANQNGSRSNLLEAVNNAAAALQKSIYSEAAVMETFKRQLRELELNGALGLFDEKGEKIIFYATNYQGGKFGNVLTKIAKLLKLELEGYSFSIKEVDIFQKVIKEKEAFYTKDFTPAIRQMLPKIARPYMNRIVKLFKDIPAINTPLMYEGRVLGVLNLSGKNIMEQDIPVMRAFGNHISVALENARLSASWKKTFVQLKSSEEKFKALVHNIPGMVYRGFSDWSAEIVSGSRELCGYSSNEFNSGKANWLNLIHKDDRERVFKQGAGLVKQEKNIVQTYRIITKKGKTKWVEDRKTSLFAKNGKFIGIDGIVFDITERQIAEEEVKNSLKEKEILLQEVYHRVKNNLQVITSLLRLKSRKVQDSNDLEIFQDCQHFIRSMSLVHESLYGSKNIGKINFKDYIRALVRELEGFYFPAKAEKVAVVYDMDELYLGVDYAIPCGMVLNELITNAFKYGFPKNKKGKINISLKAKGHKIRLIVKDNGKGMPKGFDLQSSKSFGLKLVSRLVESQLHGSIKKAGKTGTEFRIEFQKE